MPNVSARASASANPSGDRHCLRSASNGTSRVSAHSRIQGMLIVRKRDQSYALLDVARLKLVTSKPDQCFQYDGNVAVLMGNAQRLQQVLAAVSASPWHMRTKAMLTSVFASPVRRPMAL